MALCFKTNFAIDEIQEYWKVCCTKLTGGHGFIFKHQCDNKNIEGPKSVLQMYPYRYDSPYVIKLTTSIFVAALSRYIYGVRRESGVGGGGVLRA